MLTRELFLFFFSNNFGQCYFIDKSGQVQTCQPANPDSWLPQAPDGWREQQLGLGRNMTLKGFNRSYSQSLKFVGDGATILRSLMYKKRGPEEVLYLNVNKFNDLTDVYEAYYKGEIDLMNNPDDNPLEGVTVNVMEGGLSKIIKAYKDTPFEIPIDGSIPENIEVQIEGLMFHSTFNYATVPLTFNSSGTIIGLPFLNKQGNDAGAISSDQVQQNFDRTNLSAFHILLGSSSNFAFSYDHAVTGFNIKSNFKFNGSCANGCLFAVTSLNNFYPLVNTIDSSLNPTGAITGASPYNIDVTFDLLAGESVFIMFVSSDSSFTLSLQNNDVLFTFDSQFKTGTYFCIRPFDLLNLLLRKICQTAYQYPEQKIYELQSDLLNQHSNLVLTSGSALRKEQGAVIKTTLTDFYDAYDTELLASMGNLGVSQSSSEKLFFERLAYVFDSSQVTLDLGEVSKLKIKPATDLFFDTIKIGYPEQKYDEKQANAEWNTTAVYKAPVKKIAREYKKISPYRADAYGIEYTRVLVSTSNSTNNKSDNDTFILNVDYSKTVTAQAFANGTQGFYYGSGYFLPDANQGTNRGPRMQFDNITGAGIAGSFIITDLTTAGDMLKYVGGNTNVNIVANINFSFRGDISIHYYSHTNIFGQVQHRKEALANGIYYATFNVYFDGRVIYTQALTLAGGQVNNFNINTTLTNFPLKFGDDFQYEILYSSADPRIKGNTGQGSDRDGYLLIFDVSDMVLTISDDNSALVYGLKKMVYDECNLPNSQFAYNIEELTASLLLQKHGGWINSVLSAQLDKELTFQKGDKNTTLSRKLNGVTVSEGVNVPLSSLQSARLFQPWYFEFTTKVPMTFSQLLNATANGFVKFQYCGVNLNGFVIDAKVKPALEDAQDWKLLCGPDVDLSTLVDIEFNGINQIDLMNYGTAIPLLSPIPFVPLGKIKAAQYNFLHINEDWFINQVGFYPFKDDYFQKWQQNDTWELQCITNGLAPVSAKIIDSYGKQYDVINFGQVTDNAVKAPLILWQASYSPAALPEGIYFLVLSAGTGGTVTAFISEPMYVRQSWPGTLLAEYYSERNRQATIFSTGYRPSFRVEGWIDNYTPNANFATYEDQGADLEMLNAIPYLNCDLNIGDNGGVPPWVIRLVDRIMLLSSVKWDDKAFTREKEGKWEKTDVPGYPKKYWKLTIREAKNTDVVTLTTDGSLDENLTVEYNIETGAFGDGAGSGNIVQVTKVSG